MPCVTPNQQKSFLCGHFIRHRIDFIWKFMLQLFHFLLDFFLTGLARQSEEEDDLSTENELDAIIDHPYHKVEFKFIIKYLHSQPQKLQKENKNLDT